MREPKCDRCGAVEAIVHVTLNRGGPRELEWCQACYDAFRAWGNVPPEPKPAPPSPPKRGPAVNSAKRRKR